MPKAGRRRSHSGFELSPLLLTFAILGVITLPAQQSNPPAQQDNPPPQRDNPSPQRGGGGQRLLGRPSPPQPQQQQGLEYFVGSWRFTWTGRESPITAGPRSGTVKFARIGDSNFLDVHVEGSIEGAGAYKESGVMGWNADKKLLAYTQRLGADVEVLSLGDWSSPIAIRFDVAPVQVGGKMLRLRRTYSIVSAQSFMVTEELSTDGGAFVRLGNGDFRKMEGAK
jgi:hypothetical protein